MGMDRPGIEPALSHAGCDSPFGLSSHSGREAVLAGRALGTDSFLAAEQAAGALLWFVLAAAKRVRPPSALDAKLFLLVAPWGPIAVYFPCSAPLVGARCVGKRARPGKALKTSKQSSERASQQASKPEPAKSRCQNKKKPWLAPQRRGRRHWAAALK